MRAIALVVIVLALAAASPAAAVERSAAEVDDLAGRATSDPSARDALLATTVIDGVPVDMATLVGDGPTATARIAALAGQEPPPTLDEDPAATALAILSDARFNVEAGVPLSAAFMAWLTRVIGRVLTALDANVPGGLATIGWLLLIGAVAGVTAVTLSLLRRRERAIERADAAAGVQRQEQPSRLERDADAAQRNGRFEESLRLRFRAALLRLDRRGALRFHEGITSGQVVATVDHTLIPRLVGTHDEVVYGGRPATADDADESRTGWSTVVREATP